MTSFVPHRLLLIFRLAVITTWWAILAGCAGSGQRLGEPQAGAASVAPGHFGLWRRWAASELPEAGEPANTALAEGVLKHLARPCTASPWSGLDRSQQALFNHLASQLNAGLDIPLSALALGPVRGLPATCDHLLVLSGRQGGIRAGWLLIGVVRANDGQLLAVASEPVPPHASTAELAAIGARLTGWLTR